MLQAKLAQAVQANADYHHNSGSTKSSSSLELTSAPVGTWSPADGVAAQPWDLDPAEITICKRSDGSDWVLGVGSFGQVRWVLVSGFFVYFKVTRSRHAHFPDHR